MFLFEKEIRKDFIKDSAIEIVDFPDFKAWHFGPFSSKVYEDIQFFANNSFINVHLLNEPKEEAEVAEDWNWNSDIYMSQDVEEVSERSFVEEQFSLTARGVDFVESKLLPSLTLNQRRVMIEFKERMNKAGLGAILRYVYLKYPEYIIKSKIKGTVLGYGNPTSY
jgi:hypothetical protein